MRGRRILERVWRIGRWPLAVCLGVVLALMLFENSFIFFPLRYPHGEWQPSGLVFEDAWFESADGTRIHGWYVPHGQARAAVLFCHGNGGNVTHRAEIVRRLQEDVGVSVLLFDYRGYGRSEGKPNEAGVIADARAARRWLAARERIAESDIVLMGESLGGAVAVDLAAHDGARALVLQNTFSSLRDMADHCYPWLPVRGLMRTKFDSAGKIADYRGPLLQSHGDCDSIVPLELGRRLFDAANEPKRWIVLPGFDHNELPPPLYYAELAKFIRTLQ